MHYKKAFPSKYLTVEDLSDQDVVVTMSNIVIEEIETQGKKAKKLVVYFHELDKGMVCNKTNANIIADLYGEETDEWRGNKITLWPNHDVEFQGKITSAIRVRSRAPK